MSYLANLTTDTLLSQLEILDEQTRWDKSRRERRWACLRRLIDTERELLARFRNDYDN